MIFAISMDYTRLPAGSAKEHWDRTRDPRRRWSAASPTPAASIFAAAAVMVAVFFTFALSGPLPPKEMGIILGVAVLLDALLVRLLLVPVLLRLLGRWAWCAARAGMRPARRALRARLNFRRRRGWTVSHNRGDEELNTSRVRPRRPPILLQSLPTRRVKSDTRPVSLVAATHGSSSQCDITA